MPELRKDYATYHMFKLVHALKAWAKGLQNRKKKKGGKKKDCTDTKKLLA